MTYIIINRGLLIKKDTRKKIITFGVVTVFLGLTITSAINAQITNEDSSVYELLIITPKEFTRALKSLVDHKNKMGVSIKLVSLGEVYEQMFWQGRDNPEKIKYFIKTAIEKWGIEYVLLVGGRKGYLDSWHLPVRYVLMDDGYDSQHISDLYYADVYDSEGNFSSWDSDGDGLYGEWYYGNFSEDKDIDLIPDVSIGRLPCRNRMELRNVIRKIINYEKKSCDTTWFNNMVVAGGDAFEDYEGYEGEMITDDALDLMDDFNPTRLWVSNSNLDLFALKIVQAINRGCGFLYLAGHGDYWFWATSGEIGKDLRGIFTTAHVNCLYNYNKLPVFVILSCSNSNFDNSIKCLGWRMVSKRNGGSIATIGSTSVAYLSVNATDEEGSVDWLGTQFFKEYAKGEDILGKIWKNSLTEYFENFSIDWNTQAGGNFSDCYTNVKTVQQWILLGDPSLKIGGYPHPK
jgi:hypothetical protein